ncbi:diguanylate cyclase [Vibrio ostreicida]|uniref:Diguanylate cyclase n=1 Tax=Vibrio ostreicida TaxID=526588 RepID=A0ABT8C1H8_9VIBR|nr:diguanylate cyclase [Vibrio ostreicida]MDN3612469.1 diguanylate cyclase [Vibrio ostreicida]NPD10178.1 sensor domain-containing diguanylate cyclase [Vibrio ostreicida]
MKYRLERHWPLSVLAFIMLICAIGLIESIDRSQKNFLRDSLSARAKEELSIVRSELENAIVSDILAVHGLSALVASKPNLEFVGWDLLASSVMRKANHITAISLAPDDVIRYVYPLEGNETTLGLDYRTAPEQWATVKKSREIQELFIAGPISLAQGGHALIARVPIFTDPLYNRHYWGVCSVMISLESLFLEAGVDAYARQYHLSIRGLDSSGRNGPIFYGTQSTFDHAFSKETVKFPYGTWRIAAATKIDFLDQSDWFRVHAVRLLGYPMVISLVVAFGTIFGLYKSASQQALHDTLTALPNRRYFMSTLQHYFEYVEQGEHFAILNVDLDKFKSINDTYGHAAGDRVLEAVAERIQCVLTGSDFVARIGGDEFLIMLLDVTNQQELAVWSDKLKHAICHKPIAYDKHFINIEVSVGYALYDDQYSSINEMLKVADAHMYQQKSRLL